MRRAAVGAAVAMALALVLVWAALASAPPSNAGSSGLAIGSASVAANGEVTVQLVADAAAPGLAAATVDIRYDSSLVEAIGCTAFLTLCSIDLIAPDTVRIVAIDPEGLIGAGLVLGSITFRAGPFGGVAALTIDPGTLQLADPDGQTINVTPANGTITIEGPSPTASATPSSSAPPTGGATPSVSPPPSGSPAPSASNSPSASASPAPGELTWGDANCTGASDPVDSLLTLRADAHLPVNTNGCPELGSAVEVVSASPHVWGDVDCSTALDPVDSLKILRYDAGLSVAQNGGCPPIGSAVQLAGQ